MNAADLAKMASFPGSVPVAERTAARAELEQMFNPLRSDMPGQGDIAQLIHGVKAAWDAQDPMVTKGLGLQGGPVGGSNNTNNMLTSTGLHDPNKPRKLSEPKSIFVDERGVFGTVPGGFKRRPSMFGPEHLRLMVENTPLINAIILRRDRTIKRFLRPNERNRDIKFEVRKSDDVGVVRPKKGKEETLLESFLAHTGFEEDPRKMRAMHRDHLTSFMSKSIRDILTLDAWAIETVPTRNGRSIDGFHSIDAATVFLASEHGYGGDQEIIAVQVVNGLPYTTYTADELVYATMNPRSDVLHNGYGYAPPEMIVKVVTGYLNAMTYNLKGFDSNSIPKGLLNIYGQFDEKELNFFKSQWNGMVKGVNNAWALPVMVSDSKESAATFTKLNEPFSDMYFAKWMVLLTSIVCGVYGMDPTEVYSESFHAGRSSLSGSDTAERLADARDTGLEPLMSFIEDTITYNLIGRVASSDYVMRFCGIQPSDKAWEHEVQKMTMTVRQLAEANGIDPVKEAWVEAPVSPNLQGIYMASQQQEGMTGMPQSAFDGGSSGDVNADESHQPFDQDTQRDQAPEGQQRKEERSHRPLDGAETASRDHVFRKAATGEVIVVG